MNGSSESRFIAFDAFVLDRHSRELTKDGVPLRVSEQPFLVLECLLEHRGEVVTRDELRRRVWPTDTFVDFEDGLNAVVKRLRHALGDSADSPRFIETVPRRGYRFIAPIAARPEARATPPAREVRTRRWISWPLLGVLVGAVVVVTAALAWRRVPEGSIEPPRLVRLTSLPEFELWPTLAPDGLGVAFVWTGSDTERGKQRIHSTLIGVAGDPRRLSNGPGRDAFPAWSPDGRQIAFVRMLDPGREQGLVHLVTPLGIETKLSDFPVFGPIAWSPDGRYVAVHAQPDPSRASGKKGLYFLPAAGGEPIEITPTMAPAFDAMPAFSPDRRRLAFISCRIFGVCDVFSLDLDARGLPAGSPRRLTAKSVYFVWGLAWSPDGADVIYGAQAAYVTWLWRVPADGSGRSTRIDLAGAGSRMPWTDPRRNTVAYARWEIDANIHRLDRDGTDRAVVASTLPDFAPALSPDGRFLAFMSERSGDAVEIWVSAADGSGAHPVLHGPSRIQGSPHWSHDGRKIAFNSLGDDGLWHIWTVDAQGGTPHQITSGADNQEGQSWSRDGQWIYFGAGPVPGLPPKSLWRVRAVGGTPERLTNEGTGMYAEESLDGRELIYQASGRDSALLARPLAGGPARQLLPCVKATAFAVTAHGIFYVACDPTTDSVRLFDPATGRDRGIGKLTDALGGGIPFGLAVSPDGQSIFYARGSSNGSDLMLIEHFK